MRLSTIARRPAETGQITDRDIERFESYVVMVDECWEWQGHINPGGYGKFYWVRRSRLAHRVAYEWFRGPLPAELHIDHLCRNRACCNPEHLEAVTQTENNRRAGAVASARTQCAAGHEYTPENTRFKKKSGRQCVTCMTGYRKAYEERKAGR